MAIVQTPLGRGRNTLYIILGGGWGDGGAIYSTGGGGEILHYILLGRKGVPGLLETTNGRGGVKRRYFSFHPRKEGGGVAKETQGEGEGGTRLCLLFRDEKAGSKGGGGLRFKPEKKRKENGSTCWGGVRGKGGFPGFA